MKFSAERIAGATGGVLHGSAPAGPVWTDTRTLRPGSWFLALRGPSFDGQDFLDQAATAGAVGCVISRPPPSSWRGAWVQVADPTAALQDLGRAARDRLHCPVVGITGSSGKTTTRALTVLALGALGRVHHTIANLNNHLGVPMTLLASPEDAAAVVVEMGTSGPGEIAALATLARPTVRMIVNIGPAHLEELGGLSGVAREKGALFSTAAPGDILCVNLGDPRIRALRRPSGTQVITWGEDAYADVRLTEVHTDGQDLATRAKVRISGRDVDLLIPAPGHHVAVDASAALAIAVGLGVQPVDAAAAMCRYRPVGMRQRIEEPQPGVVAINDAYNANPASTRAALAVLADLPGRRVAVLGDMLELGRAEGRLHRELLAHADSLGLERLILVGERMAAAAPVVRHTPCLVASHAEAAAALRSWLMPEDRVLFKGSRGAQVERVLQGIRVRSEAD